jgi:hypothetical protein
LLVGAEQCQQHPDPLVRRHASEQRQVPGRALARIGVFSRAL